jgi:hypothetical protein
VGNTPGTADRWKMRAKLLYCRWQQHRNRLLRAYQIAFRPFERTLGRLKKVLLLFRSGNLPRKWKKGAGSDAQA